MKTFSTSYSRGGGWSDPLPNMDSINTLVLVFGTRSFSGSNAIFDELKDKYKQAVIAGCSTAGEIMGEAVFDETLVVSITQFENTQIRLFTTPVLSMDASLEVGSEIAKNLKSDDLKGVLVLADGLNVNGTDLVKGINSHLDESVKVTGGLAGDGEIFEQTWILVDGMPQSQYVCGIGFYGNSVKIDHGSKGGWQTFGPKRLITKSDHNVLYELDGKPALKLYKNYLGDMAEGLPATGLRYPLALSSDESKKLLVRTILAVDEEQQSLTFAGDIPEGYQVRLMFASFDNLVDGAEKSAEMLDLNDDISTDVLAIAISCVGRRMVMNEDPGAELEATLDMLPDSTQQVGFYSYGELSPFAKNGSCDLHNQTMTLTTIYE